jgi:hypothetical protein
MNANRTRAILAQQKARELATPKPLPEGFTLPALTRDERKAIYAPRPSSSAPQQLQGPQWVSAWRSVSRITYGLTALLGVLFGGVIAKESKKGIKP